MKRQHTRFRLLLSTLFALSLVVACEAGGSGGGSAADVTGADAPVGDDIVASSVKLPGTSSGPICEAENISACVCQSGYIGDKTCAEDGSGYGPCVCQDCTAQCEGLTCGGDGCGGSCGLCFGDDICKKGVCKLNVDCPIGGTGTLVGDQIKNVTFQAAYGLDLELHSYCGEAKAIWITLTAGWCTACTALAPTFQNIHEQFKSEDIEWLLLVGDDGSYAPADWSYAKQYHAAKGYQDTWTYVADPAFVGIVEAAAIADADGSFYLPTHVILGSDMSIQYIDTDETQAMIVLQSLL